MNKDANTGLSEQQAGELLLKFGKNKIVIERKKSILSLLFVQYKSIISLLLFVAALFSFSIGEVIDGSFILFVLILNGLFGFIQEYRAEKTLEKLKNLVIPQTRVIRDGEEKQVSVEVLVPGDVVVLNEGDRVPADCRLLTDVFVQVDESVFSGESLPVEKKRQDEIFSGTYIMRGRGLAAVEKTGTQTKLGEIAHEMQQIQKPKIPLAENLNVLGKRLAVIAIVLSFILFPIGLLQNRALHDLVLTVVSLAVAVIPEGLPLVVTITLAVGAYRMAKEKAIVRKMAAIETLGSTNVILTDKTGTLTQNKMSVKKYWVSHQDHLKLLLRASVLGNTASLALKEDGEEFDIVGDKTDGALLAFVKKHVDDVHEFRKVGEVISEKPFDAVSKIIEVEWKHQDALQMFVRGAPETILTLIKESEKKKLEEKMLEFAKEGFRVIGFAYKERGDQEFSLLGIVAIYDPPRIEAERAVQEAKAAGIRVVMVTGDNPVTAKSISEEIGLIQEGDLVLTHDEIESLSDQELSRELPKVRVFARMRPHDKLRLVKLYKQAGFVVAVTGDGVNDALALSQANIGVAMGRGTDVAKEAADLVITDDNLNTIVKAVEEGRGIFDNIVKVVVFLLSSNLSEFLVIFLGILLGLPIPLTPTQILWVNLISDGLPAMALSTDIKRGHLLKQKPRNITEQILNNKRAWFIAKITIPFSLLLVFIYYLALLRIPENDARFLLFNYLVAGEMLIVIIVRGGLFPINRFLIISIVISLFLQLIVTINPILRAALS